ncbi:MAG: ATP synthase F1 subunit delta ['Waltheria sp.' little leaf phytoplasma]|nr:ATP synthase F1 subunit delta ['Waltheria sp.' little leaf phytoplasma]
MSTANTAASATNFATHSFLFTSPFQLSVSRQASTTTDHPAPSSPYDHQKPACGYAAALLDIAQCNNSLDEVQKDVQKFSKLLRNDQIQAFLSDPMVGEREKGKAAKELAVKGKFNRHLVRLLKMLIERNKLEIVSEVLGEFERIHDELSETKQVWISSDKEIEKHILVRIARRVQKLTGAVKVKVRNLVRRNIPAFAV